MRILSVLLVLAVSCVAETKLGKPLALKAPATVGDLLAKADQFAGQVVQVKGKVTEVCQMMGCWMMLADEAAGHGQIVRAEEGKYENGEWHFLRILNGDQTDRGINMKHEDTVVRIRMGTY